MQDRRRYNEALTYARDEPDILSLKECYDNTVVNVQEYLQQTRTSYDDRHELWPGKSGDHRKKGPTAFPWDGASDLETRIVEDKIRTYVSMLTDAMRRSHIQAYPVEVGDQARARIVSSFLKWMHTSWIQGFERYLDQSANYFLEKGLMASYVGWEQKKSLRLKKVSMTDIPEELAAVIANGEYDSEVIQYLMTLTPENVEIPEARAAKTLRQLRATGEGELPTIVLDIDRPVVRACAPDRDVLFPSWCIDPLRAPYAFYRDFMTPQEILVKVESGGWDENWADLVLDRYMGAETEELGQQSNNQLRRYDAETSELVEVLTAYQRLIDEDTGAEGVYCTTFHRNLTNDKEAQPWAKRELLSDFHSFPFVLSELSSDEDRIYETTTFPELIRSAQHSIKVERDSRIDRNSLATLPELFYPAGRPPSDRGPGSMVGYRRKGEYYYGDTPRVNPDAVAMDQHLMEQIDNVLGLNFEDPNSSTKRGYYIHKFLTHQRDVLSMSYEMYKLYGPEEMFFRVTGLPDHMQMTKQEDERLDITISFDTLQTDPDNVEKMLGQIFQIIPLDKGGRINMDAVITYAASAISPTLASHILQTGQEGAQELLAQFTMDWAKMRSGIRVDAPPNGAGIILPAMQTLQQEPDVMQELSTNEAWAARVTNYVQQLQMQEMQAQNAETGKRGASPAPIQLNEPQYPQQQNGRPQAARY